MSPNERTVKPRTAVIVNPAAGGGASRRAGETVVRELARRGAEATLHVTRHRGHAPELVHRLVREGVGTVVAVGGDGTAHEVANGILRAREDSGAAGPAAAVMGVIPAGTGNDFAKLLSRRGSDLDRPRACDIVAAGEIRNFDVGRVSWPGGCEYFINGMGTGIDVEVVRQIEGLPRLPGFLSYLIGLLRALVRFRPVPIRLRLDGQTVEKRVILIAVGNSDCIGGGFRICPRAVPDDGRFDICMVGDLGVGGIMRTLPRVLRGTHAGLPGVSMADAEVVELEAMDDDPLCIQLDGELREPAGVGVVRVAIEAGVLPVLAERGG